MPQRIAVRLPDDLVSGLDALIDSGVAANRAAAIRVAVAALVDQRRRHAVGQAIADGYGRRPQTDDEVQVARAAAMRSIIEEPW